MPVGQNDAVNVQQRPVSRTIFKESGYITLTDMITRVVQYLYTGRWGGGVETVGLCVGDDGTVEVLGPSLLPLLLMRCY